MSPQTIYDVSEGQRFATDLNLEVVTCVTCRIVYAIPASLASSARAYPGDRQGGWNLCCPMGHTWHYTGRSIEERLKDERRMAARATARADQAEASARAYRGAATRARNERDGLKRRAAAGVCPCCNRTFKQLSRHMASQHPGYGPEPDAMSIPKDAPSCEE